LNGKDLSDVPVQLADVDVELYPASDPSGESVVVSTRIPASWAVQIDRIREKPGTNFPVGLWPTRADFVRWGLGLGIQRWHELQERLDNSDPDDRRHSLIGPSIFVEKTAGNLLARATIIDRVHKSAEEIAKTIDQLMGIREYQECAQLITSWIEGAAELSRRDRQPFWERLAVRALLINPNMTDHVEALANEGYLDDEYITASAIEVRRFAEDLDMIPTILEDE
jgi:hypothetical protein